MTDKLHTASSKSRNGWKMLELAALATGLGGSAAACLKMRDEIQSDEWVVMPNHFHVILIINGRGTACRALDNRDSQSGTARRAPTMEQFGRNSGQYVYLFSVKHKMEKCPRNSVREYKNKSTRRCMDAAA